MLPQAEKVNHCCPGSDVACQYNVIQRGGIWWSFCWQSDHYWYRDENGQLHKQDIGSMTTWAHLPRAA